MTFVMLRRACLAAMLLLCATPWALDTPAQVKKIVQGSNDTVGKLWLKMDLKGLQAHFQKIAAENYSSVTDGTKKSRKQVYEGLAEAMKRIKKVYEYTGRVESVVVKGSRAAAKIKGKILADMLDDQGQQHRIELYQDVTSNWVKAKGTWKCEGAVTKSTKMLVDGKTVPIGA